ncbi:sugar phosphate nucleotidyltransferase [Marinicrinis sediminis]|uniref:Sugar phosphate nucleotidyltransferase n=1 Tax=Marinicrinis sediminis TaxID=1652465 RepID=A0ABW5REL5_9BACL
MKAVIMAGGKGTRLRPLTSNTPKPMVPLLDRPVMAYIIDLLKKHDITDIAVTMQYMPEQIKNYFGDGSEFGVHLSYFQEEVPLGTAGSIKNAEDFLDERFIVISGDALTDFDLSQAIEFHAQKQALATLVLTQVAHPLEFGVVMTDEDGAIYRFLEKPTWSEVFSDTVNTGIYILEPETLKWMNEHEPMDFSKDLFPMLLQHQQPLYGYVAEGYWSDIGSVEQYRQAHWDLLEGKVEAAITGLQVKPGIWISPEADISPDVSVKAPVWIGSDVIVEPDCMIGPRAVLGNGCIVNQGGVIESAILWEDVFTEGHSEVKGATIGKNCLIRTNACVMEHAVIGDHCQVGRNSRIHPQVKIYPYKFIDHQSEIRQSILWQDARKYHLFGDKGIEGQLLVDLSLGMLQRLACAIASVLPKGARVLLEHDKQTTPKLAIDALKMGLLASGIHLITGKGASLPAVRHQVVYQRTDFAIYAYQSDFQQQRLRLELLDKEGLPIPKNQERQIQSAFDHEQFRQIGHDEVGRELIEVDSMLPYWNAMEAASRICTGHRDKFELLSGGMDGKRQWIMVCEEQGKLNLHGRAVARLASRWISYPVTSISPLGKSETEIPAMIKAIHAQGALICGNDGTLKGICNERGEWLEEQELLLIQLMVYLHMTEESELTIPVNMPDILEEWARLAGKKVHKGKADYRAQVRAGKNGSFFLYHDVMYFSIGLDRLLTDRDVSISAVLEGAPDFVWLKRQVACSWTDKGKVMRFLMRETKGKPVELIDGIKFMEEDGWTLVLPEEDQSGFHLYVYAQTREQAEQLARTYSRKIIQYRKLPLHDQPALIQSWPDELNA